jgi:hypothetical protein
MKFNIGKKRLAKEIVLFWCSLIPILIVFAYVFFNNSIINGKITSLTDLLNEYYKSRKDLQGLVDISIESFNIKIDSLEKAEGSMIYYQSNYPELSFFTGHFDERLPNLLFVLGIPTAHKDSIIESRLFWGEYQKNYETIYVRDKQIFNEVLKIQNLSQFKNLIDLKLSIVFNGDSLNENMITVKCNRLKDKVISDEKRNDRIINIIIIYFLILYPLRLIIISIVWSIKTLKK